jgi:chromosome segregation ATPase
LDALATKQKLYREQIQKQVEDARGKGQTITPDLDLLSRVEASQRATTEAETRSKNLQTVVKTREDAIAAINASVSAGAMTIGEGQDAIKKAYEQTTPEIEKQTKAFQDFLATNKDLDPTKIEQYSAAIKKMRVEAQYVDPLWKGIKDTFNQSFSTNITTFFDSISESIGGLIAKTKSWSDVMTTVKTAAAQLFAQLLRDIANYVIKAEAAKLASSLFGAATDTAVSPGGASTAGGRCGIGVYAT